MSQVLLKMINKDELISLLTPPIFGATIFFSSYFGNSIATNQLPLFFSSISTCHFHKSIATVPPPQFLQCHCHNFLVATIFFSSHFRQLDCHNSYFLSPPFPTIPTTWLPQLVSLQAARISIISLSKFNFSPSSITSLIFPLSHTFSCNFNIDVAEIHHLFSFFQINLNNNYITNKEIFLQYLAKRLICLSYGTKRTLLLKIETCNLHINIIYTEVYLFIYLTLVCLMPSHKETDELIHEIFLWYLRANCRPKNSNLLFFFFFFYFLRGIKFT